MEPTASELSESRQMGQPIEVVRMKRRATTMFHNDHDDGDTAIYGLVREMLEWHNKEISELKGETV